MVLLQVLLDAAPRGRLDVDDAGAVRRGDGAGVEHQDEAVLVALDGGPQGDVALPLRLHARSREGVQVQVKGAYNG